MNATLWGFRVLILVVPVVAALLTHRLCRELQARDGPVVDPFLPDDHRHGNGNGSASDSARSTPGEPRRSGPVPSGR